GEPAPIWAKSQPADLGRVSFESAQFLAGYGVPDADAAIAEGVRRRIVTARRCDPSAVRVEGHAQDRPPMSGEGTQCPAILAVPEDHGPVMARRGELVAVGAEHDGKDHLPMPTERLPHGAGGDIPEPHHLVLPARSPDTALP